jgi:hypothetical protein
MSTHKSSSIASSEIITTLKPALASINTARGYMGNPSRSKFYADVLPHLETIKFGDTDKRRWVIVASMDRLIDARRTTSGSDEQIQSALDPDTSARGAARPDFDQRGADRSATERGSTQSERSRITRNPPSTRTA